MNVYKEILEIILKREYALLGRVHTQKIFKDLGLSIDDMGNLNENNSYDAEILEKLIVTLKQSIGYIAILVIRLPVRRKLMQNHLDVPSVLM